MTGAASQQAVQVGPVKFCWDASGLRHLSWPGTEVLASLYVAVRDENWGTVPGTVTVSEPVDAPGGWGVRWAVQHDDGEVRFSWHGLLRAQSTEPGRVDLAFEMDGVADGDFRANRIGVCLLHPLSLAGKPVATRHSGRWRRGRFPLPVTPDAPFTGFDALHFPVAGGGTAEIILGGGPFEMEDQRNWTDASFKTYCPPLRVPFPRQVTAGERIRQAVMLRLRGPAIVRHEARTAAAARRRDDLLITVGAAHNGPGAAPPPRLPAIGLGLAPPEAPVTERDRALLRALQPRHLHAVLDTARPAWPADLIYALNEAAVLHCPANLEVVVAGAVEVPEVARALARAIRKFERAGERPPFGRAFIYDRACSQTTQELAVAWAEATGTRPGGGSRANYAELNRADLPAGLLSGLAFAINPQVHAFDDESVMETLAVQPVVTRDAVARAAGLPVTVGPVTLRPRFEAAATGPPRPQPPGALPPAADPRQATVFAAAWTAGSITALASAGAGALTYFETAGAGGVLAGTADLPPGYPPSGTVYPVYHVLAVLAPLGGAPLIPVTSADPAAVAGLGVATPDGPLVVLANLCATERTVRVAGAPAGDLLRLPVAATPAGGQPQQASGIRPSPLVLRPWEVVAVGSVPSSVS